MRTKYGHFDWINVFFNNKILKFLKNKMFDFCDDQFRLPYNFFYRHSNKEQIQNMPNK